MAKQILINFAIIIVCTFLLSFTIITKLNTQMVSSPKVYYYEETVTTKDSTVKTIIMYMNSSNGLHI